MAKFAVAFASLYDNNLTIEFVKAETDIEAIYKHTQLAEYAFDGDTLEEKIISAFNCDSLLAVKQIPDNLCGEMPH